MIKTLKSLTLKSSPAPKGKREIVNGMMSSALPNVWRGFFGFYPVISPSVGVSIRGALVVTNFPLIQFRVIYIIVKVLVK